MLKKLLSITLAVAMILGVNTYAFASNNENFTIDPSQIRVEHGSSNNFYRSSKIEDVIEKEAKKEKNVKYSVTIAVEQPNKGSYDAAALKLGGGKDTGFKTLDVGHTFIVLGNHTKKEGSYSTKGFYPAEAMSLDDVLDKTSVSGTVSDDTGHKYHAKKTYYITKSQYDKISTYISDNSSSDYNIVSYNCTTFAVKALEAGNINDTGIKERTWQVPKSFDKKIGKENVDKARKFKGYYPGAAGQQLK